MSGEKHSLQQPSTRCSMRQNNQYIWYLPLYFFLFFSFYVLLKFCFIFFFMTAYSPSFLFDFTFLYAFSTLDYLQLLFIGMIVLLADLYLHIYLSKKHLQYSFLLTLFLLGGIGLRIATSPFSLSFIYHYIIFSFLLLVLIVDHRLFLVIPSDFSTSTAKTKLSIDKISVPVFSTLHSTKPKHQTNRFSTLFNTFSQSTHDLKQVITSKIALGSPKPTTVSESKQHALIHQDTLYPVARKPDQKPFVHPVEQQADSISTTKQLLLQVGSTSFAHLDSKIKASKFNDISSVESFFSTPSQYIERDYGEEISELSKILNKMDECAIVISRGVVKAVNQRFLLLIQRPTVDILHKDFIKFVSSECYSDFKYHCSQRLSGASSSVFPIVLLTKKNEKIPLQATVRSVTIQGEQVEITLFQKVNT